MTHSTHFIYGYMASEQKQETKTEIEKKTERKNEREKEHLFNNALIFIHGYVVSEI